MDRRKTPTSFNCFADTRKQEQHVNIVWALNVNHGLNLVLKTVRRSGQPHTFIYLLRAVLL